MPVRPSREICFSLLHRLYVLGECEAGGKVAFWRHEGLGGLTSEQTQGAIAWLQSERLVRRGSGVGEVSLTAFGVACVERALGNPDVATELFPAISKFYDLDGSSSFGLCRTTLQLWLDQLDDCVDALDSSGRPVRSLETTISELEQRVMSCKLDSQSLQLSLLELRASL